MSCATVRPRPKTPASRPVWLRIRTRTAPPTTLPTPARIPSESTTSVTSASPPAATRGRAAVGHSWVTTSSSLSPKVDSSSTASPRAGTTTSRTHPPT